MQKAIKREKLLSMHIQCMWTTNLHIEIFHLSATVAPII